MTDAWRVALAVLILMGTVPAMGARAAPSAPPWATGTGSTSTGLSGYYTDMALDAVRGRLYLSDAAPFGTQGVSVVNTTTRSQVAFLPVANPTGIALSPSGRFLAVATDSSMVEIVNPDTLQVLRSIPVSTDGWSGGYLWSVAFYTDDHVFVTLGQPYNLVGGTHSASVFNVSTGALEGGMSEGIYGFYADAVVRIDALHHRAYIIDTVIPSVVWVYDITSLSAITRVKQWNVTTGPDSILSADGTRFYMSNGEVYSTLNFTSVGNTGDTGSPALDSAAGVLAYGAGNRVDILSASTNRSLGRYAFSGTVAYMSFITPYVLDLAHEQAFVANQIANNFDLLNAVPLVAGFVDPFPWPDGIVSMSYSIGVIVSGGIAPSSLSMRVDNASVPFSYSASYLAMGWVPPLSFPDGDHQVAVSGLSPSNTTLSLVWTFRLDTKPPEIIVHGADVAYRTPGVTIDVTLVDPDLNRSLVYVNGNLATVNPSNDTVAVPMALTEGGNPLSVVAYDTLGHNNNTFVPILYVPPTSHFVDVAANFALDYPSRWSTQTDVDVNGSTVALILRAPATANGTPNTNVIVSGQLSDYSSAGTLRILNESLTNVSRLPGFMLLDPPHAVVIANLSAATYSFFLSHNGTWVFERQYLIANASLRQSWVVTFAAAGGDAFRYDPLFRWVAESFQPYVAPSAVPFGLSGATFLVGVTLAIAAAVGAAAILLWLRRPARRPPAPPAATQPPSASPPPATGQLPPVRPP